MKVNPRQADSVVRNPPAELRAVLFFGPDAGLVHERAVALAAAITGDLDDVFRYVELSEAALKVDRAVLVDEALARSLTGGRRVILVNASDGLSADFEALLAHPGLADPESGLVIARAGDLGARSALRRLFEAAANGAAIACYADDAPALHRLVAWTLQDAGVSADRNAIDLIVGSLGTDRQLNRRELEKLVLFAGRGGSVDVDDIAACLGDSAAVALDDTVYAAADGDHLELDRALERAWSEGLTPVALLRAGQRHLQRLHIVGALRRQRGLSLQDAIKSLRPQVFWKVEDRFRAQAGRWSSPAIEQALARLTETEILAKSTGVPDRTACARAFLAISQLARTNSRQ